MAIGCGRVRDNRCESKLPECAPIWCQYAQSDPIGCQLHRAELPRADLSRALLHGANMSGANLADTNLSDADLTGVVLDGIFYNAKTERCRLEDIVSASQPRAERTEPGRGAAS
ncbi:pentapeptide repeat-containing protein [Nocardia abscessus]|uniref:pentapeptide repeat-containing protein n=1 Tax=Nocardia abscessus TaxID=120957 RepID=UPI002458003A|nr:pentapeptide repeat-containing protein [Nocardia abscessus]